MKRCKWCGRDKPLTEFVKRPGGGTKSHCYECNRKRQQEQYRLNPERRSKAVARNIKRLRQKRARIIDEFKGKPCVDCGVRYPPYVMDFDHRDPDLKVGSVSEMVGQLNASWERLVAEIAKCDLVCSNCHRERTHQRKLAKRRPTEGPLPDERVMLVQLKPLGPFSVAESHGDPPPS